MKRALLLTASILMCTNSSAQTPSNSELEDIFSRNIALANAGDNSAQMAVCSAYSYGLGIKADPKQALRFCLRAAETGEPRALLQLADFYLKGIGTKADVVAAAHWYKQATKNGLVQGHVGLATIYFDLDNTLGTRNLEMAAVHAKHAAAAGSHMGEMYLGVMYFNGFEPGAGEDAEIDYAAATLWFEKSAQQGNLVSAAYLANIYASETEHHNSYKAYFWASVLKTHLPDTYPQDVHSEYETELTSAERDAVAEEQLLMERGWQKLSVATASI